MTAHSQTPLNTLYDHPDLLGLDEEAPLRPGGLALTRGLLQKAEIRIGDRVLDIGCGRGQTVVLLRRLGCKAWGVDCAKESVTAALAKNPHLPLQVADAETLPFADSVFDAVTAECVFCLLPQKPRVLTEIRRVLKPHGKLLLSDLYSQTPDVPPPHLALLTCMQNLMGEGKIRKLLEQAQFTCLSWNDHRQEYLGFLAELLFNAATPDDFWQSICASAAEPAHLKEELKQQKFSYYSAVWQNNK